LFHLIVFYAGRKKQKSIEEFILLLNTTCFVGSKLEEADDVLARKLQIFSVRVFPFRELTP